MGTRNSMFVVLLCVVALGASMTAEGELQNVHMGGDCYAQFVDVDDGPCVGAVSGTVRAEDGSPVAGATVCLYETWRSYDAETPLPPNVTQALLDQQRASSIPFTSNYPFSTGSRSTEITRLSVNVRPRGRHQVSRTVQTDEKGRFQFSDLPVSPYGLHAFTDSGTAQETLTLEEATPVQDLTISLHPSISVEGFVVTTEGTPVPHAEVQAFSHREDASETKASLDSPLLASAHTDTGGRFVLTYVPKENAETERSSALHWDLVAKAAGYLSGRTEHTGKDQKPPRITLPDGASVRIRVLNKDTGEALEGIEVALSGPSKGFAGKTGPDGIFTWRGLVSGKYSASLPRLEWLLVEKAPEFEISSSPEAAEVSLHVQPCGYISGRVVDSETGEGIRGAHVAVRPCKYFGALSDEQGRYRIGGLAAGTYSVALGAGPGYQPKTESLDRRVEVKYGQDAAGIDFEADKGLRVAGRVVDKDGNPAHSVRVHSIQGGLLQAVFTDEAGRFEFSGFAPGKKASVWARDFIRSQGGQRGLVSRRQWFPTLPPEGVSGITLVLEGRPGSIEGRVINRSGAGVPCASVLVKEAEGDESTQTTAHTGADGSFSVPRLLPGKYIVSFAGTPPEDGGEVEVKPGQVASGVTLVSSRR